MINQNIQGTESCLPAIPIILFATRNGNDFYIGYKPIARFNPVIYNNILVTEESIKKDSFELKSLSLINVKKVDEDVLKLLKEISGREV